MSASTERATMSGLHIAWVSDSPDTPSGFGNVTRAVCEGLARRGHRVTIFGWQTKRAFDWNGCRVLPMAKDPMGGDALYAYLLRHRPEAVIALADVWWLPYFASPHVRRQLELTETPWILYFPIDGENAEGLLPPSWIELLSEVDIPIAMSAYGQEVGRRCGVNAEVILHGVDLGIFSPPPDREAAKAALGLAGSFVVLSDSRNQPRKLLPRLLDVFARFAEDRPDAVLHLHTDPDDEFASSSYYSYDVRADIAHLGLDGKVRFTPGFTMRQGQGLPIEELARYYQAADVHLLASSGEGFGLPSLQAAAAGAVPLACAYSASRELVEGHGEAIAVADWGEKTAIGADARGASDVRLPTVPRASVVGGVKVPRRPGALRAAPGDELVVLALQRVFPVLETIDEGDRFQLAQAVLALNVSGGLPDEVLVDAALFGFPCVGTAAAAPQAVLWPELATDDPLHAVSLARELLTNPGRTRRAIERALETCITVYAPDERMVAADLRSRHALQRVGGS